MGFRCLGRYPVVLNYVTLYSFQNNHFKQLIRNHCDYPVCTARGRLQDLEAGASETALRKLGREPERVKVWASAEEEEGMLRPWEGLETSGWIKARQKKRHARRCDMQKRLDSANQGRRLITSEASLPTSPFHSRCVSASATEPQLDAHNCFLPSEAAKSPGPADT